MTGDNSTNKTLKQLDKLYLRVMKNINYKFVKETEIVEDIRYISRCEGNRSGSRLLLSCLLAKMINPDIDPRKPYTEIGSKDAFSGRTYDEKYITHFINKYELPLNTTTAFLTPTLRNINEPLNKDKSLVGRPKELYTKTLNLLHLVALNLQKAENVFLEMLRQLLIFKEEKQNRLDQLMDSLSTTKDALLLSSESIVILLQQHLSCKKASRLPVLMVAAAYNTIKECLGERIKPLQHHNAADKQTKSLGDIEVCIENEENIVTVYEMKMKQVSIDDIDCAKTKIINAGFHLDNYLFVTTENTPKEVLDYAANCYGLLGGTEIGILDCLSFMKSFLSLFHRSRIVFLDNYQDLLLKEPESAVSQALKEVFLTLRIEAESE
ncbi:MAG: restriction endonuclease, SacI family [Candidatus Cloacimonetes bacterium]|nr:restriction endonuclease, SacI family [Candidatus Cloacimonadota bacterium]